MKHEIQVEEHSDIEEQVVEQNNEVNENDEHNNENDFACRVDLNIEEKLYERDLEDDKDNIKLEVNNITSELEDLQDSELCENIPGCHDMIEIVKHDIQVEQHSDIY